VEVVGQAGDQVEFARAEACLTPVDEQPAGGTADEVLAVHVGVHQPLVRQDDVETLTEVFWNTRHGQATLDHKRTPAPDPPTSRLDLLLDSFS
jgi:hypothetical protein